MGIIDAVPVAHRIRPPVTGYNYETAVAESEALFAREPHLTAMEAFQVLRVYS
jgi:hypothetical protein